MDRRTWIFLTAGLIVVLLIAGIASGFASGEPDGLEKVAIDEGFDDAAADHALADGPLADYQAGDEEGRLSTGIAGVLGVAITLAITTGLLMTVRRFRTGDEG